MSTYREFHQAPRPEWGAAVRKTISNDIGPKYAAVSLVVEFEDGSERLIHSMPYCLTEAGGGLPNIDEVCNSILHLFLHPDQDWIWESNGPVITERQMDHLGYYGLVASGGGDGEKKEKKTPRGKPPICYAIYGMLRVLVALKARPQLLLNPTAFAKIKATGIDMMSLGYPNLRFVPVSGHQKAGLKGKHGDERKGGEAFDKALELMEEQGDDKAVEYLQNPALLVEKKKKKPRQDVVDTYLQGRRYLADLREEERKKLKRPAPTADAKGAPAPKKVKK